MKARRGPWLSGLIVAVIGAVWMIGLVVGGLGSMAAGVARLSGGQGYGDNELRQWLIDEERDILGDVLRGRGWDRSKPIEPQPAPLTSAQLDDAVANPDDVFLFAAGSDLHALFNGQDARIERRRLPDWHPARWAGDLGDHLILAETNELHEAKP